MTHHDATIMTKSEVCQALRVSASTLERRIKSGLFPPGKQLPGGRNRFWASSKVEQIIREILE